MGLGTRNVVSISTVRSQIPPPKKPLINAHHIAPSEVTSRRLVKSHLEKRNGRTIKKGRQTSIITNSSDTSNISALELGGQVYRYWARLGPAWLPDAQSVCPRDRMAERFEGLAERPSGRDLWRLGRETETLEDLTGTVEDYMDLADGRPSP